MKEQIIEEAATALLWKKYPYHPPKDYGYWKDMFKEGVKWNEEIMIDFANWCRIHDKKFPNEVWTIHQLHTKYFAETYGSKGSELEPKTNLDRLPFPELVEELAKYYEKVPIIEATSSQTEKCCTPEGQIKRYVDCIGCDRKASSQTTSDKWKEYQDWLNEVPEISDEKIEKAARDYDNAVIYGPPLLHFEQGAFWYREQLKTK